MSQHRQVLSTWGRVRFEGVVVANEIVRSIDPPSTNDSFAGRSLKIWRSGIIGVLYFHLFKTEMLAHGTLLKKHVWDRIHVFFLFELVHDVCARMSFFSSCWTTILQILHFLFICTRNQDEYASGEGLCPRRRATVKHGRKLTASSQPGASQAHKIDERLPCIWASFTKQPPGQPLPWINTHQRRAFPSQAKSFFFKPQLQTFCNRPVCCRAGRMTSYQIIKEYEIILGVIALTHSSKLLQDIGNKQGTVQFKFLVPVSC